MLFKKLSTIGDPIHCNEDGNVDKDMFEAHCWIHGTFHLPNEYRVDRTKYCSYEEVRIKKKNIFQYLNSYCGDFSI